MPSDYEYDLPSMSDNSWDSGSSWSDSGDYNLSDSGNESSLPSTSEYRADDDWSSGWFTDSSSGSSGSTSAPESTTFDGVWKWLGSNAAGSIAAGALDSAFKMWAANKAKDEEHWESMNTEAILKNARIGKHNESINKSWDLGLPVLQK